MSFDMRAFPHAFVLSARWWNHRYRKRRALPLEDPTLRPFLSGRIRAAKVCATLAPARGRACPMKCAPAFTHALKERKSADL